MKRVAIHQPNLFPWLGFFDKMRRADVFVLLDSVPFNRRSYQHRVLVAAPNGPRWLTVPVLKRGRYGEPTDEVRIDASRPWRHDHLETLRHTYAKAPGFAALAPDLAALYETPCERLVEFTIPGIEWLRGRLEIDTEVVRASALLEGRGLAGSELLAELVLACGGDVYLSGPTGTRYMDEASFSSRGLGLEYTRFVPFAYEQRGDGFTDGLSALDLLCNVPDAAACWRSRWSA